MWLRCPKTRIRLPTEIGGAGSSKRWCREYGGSLRRVRCQANGLAYASTLGWMRVEPQQRNAHPTEDQSGSMNLPTSVEERINQQGLEHCSTPSPCQKRPDWKSSRRRRFPRWHPAWKGAAYVGALVLVLREKGVVMRGLTLANLQASYAQREGQM